MKKNGFTIVEVSILFVIFLIVAFLVAPLSLDDTIQAKNTSKWRRVQSDFSNIFYSVNNQRVSKDISLKDAFENILANDFQANINPYKITYMDGSTPNAAYRFDDYKVTYSKAVIAYKIFENSISDLKGVLMYDVNGKMGPNVWGKDVFGLNIYNDKFEPFCKQDAFTTQKMDCARGGTGLCCSNYYLIGGNFD